MAFVDRIVYSTDEGEKPRKSRVVLGTIKSEGKEISGVIKLFRDLEPVAKEARILERLKDSKPQLPVARVLDYRSVEGGEFQIENWGFLLAETEVLGPRIADEVESIPLARVQRDSAILFDQLAAVSDDKMLNAEGIGYCGDISSLNTKRTTKGYVIVDWSAVIGENVARATPRYVPPEVVKGEQPMGVNADIFGLGSLLVRALVGREKFRAFFSDGGKRTFLKFDQIEEYVHQSTHAFFMTVLAEDPYERVVEGEITPGGNYMRLKKMFTGR